MDEEKLFSLYDSDINQFLNQLTPYVDELYINGLTIHDYICEYHFKCKELIIYYKNKEDNKNIDIQLILLLPTFIDNIKITYINLQNIGINQFLLNEPFSYNQICYDYLQHKLLVSDIFREKLGENRISLINPCENYSTYLDSLYLLQDYYNLDEDVQKIMIQYYEK